MHDEQIVPPSPKKSCLHLHLGVPASNKMRQRIYVIKAFRLVALGHSSPRHALSLFSKKLNSTQSQLSLTKHGAQHNTAVSQTQNNMELNTTQNRVSQTQYNTEPDTQDTNLFSNKGKFMYHGQKLKIKSITVAIYNSKAAIKSFQMAASWKSGGFCFVLFGGVFFHTLQELKNKGPGECLLTWFILITPNLPPQNESGFWKQPLPLRSTRKPTFKPW